MLAQPLAVLLTMLILLLIIGGVIALQVFLSSRENKWLGLTLPIINIVFSLVIGLGIMVFTAASMEITTVTYKANGERMEEVVERQESDVDIEEGIIQVAIVMGWMNIPTVILLAIHLGCRDKYKKKLQLQKMNIQDLE